MDKEILLRDNKFKYQLLDRMRGDCLYYLGNGNKHVKFLWSGSVDQHIEDMMELYKSFSKEERPEWISLDEILKLSDQMDHRSMVWKEEIGTARLIDIQGKHHKESDEVFFSIKYRPKDSYNKDSFTCRPEYGYIKVSPRMREIFDTLFQENKSNMHIDFIEWDDSWNMVFCDGIYISSRMCRVEKRDFAEWRREVTECQ